MPIFPKNPSPMERLSSLADLLRASEVVIEQARNVADANSFEKLNDELVKLRRAVEIFDRSGRLS